MPESYAACQDASKSEFPTARASFFLPPSPSASSVLSQSPRWQSKDVRKRPRLDTRRDTNTPRATRPNLTSAGSYGFDAPSPAPLVSTDYIFAGGTPSTSRYDNNSAYDFEQDLRPTRYAQPGTRNSYSTTPFTPQSIERGGKRRRLSTQQNGWGRTVWNLAGGIAGKAINFCWTAAFNGFHAGGGQGYDMAVDTPVVVADDPADISRSRDVFDEQYREDRSTPVPGAFPESRPNMARAREYSWEDLPTPTASAPANNGSSLKSNWVVVDAPAMNDVESSPARKRSRPSTANLYAQPSGRSPMSRPKLPARHSASFASNRASPAQVRSSHPIRASTPCYNRPNSSGSASDQQQHKRTRTSLASPRGSDCNGNTTPQSPDVVKFEKKIQKQNQRADNSMRRLNSKMEDLIREANEALGSRIEVLDGEAEDTDEGYHEGSNSW